MNPPGSPVPAGSQFFQGPDSKWYIQYPWPTIQIRDANGVAIMTSFMTGNGDYVHCLHAYGGETGTMKITRTGDQKVVAPRPSAETGFENQSPQCGIPLVGPLATAALIWAMILDGLSADATNSEEALIACARLVPVLSNLKNDMGGLAGTYNSLSDRLDAAIATATGSASHAEADWFSQSRGNLDNAIEEINRRIGVANAAFSKWQAWDNNQNCYSPDGREVIGPRSTGAEDMINVSSLYNEAVINASEWCIAVEAAENVAANLPLPNSGWVSVTVGNMLSWQGQVNGFELTPNENYSGPTPNVLKDQSGTEYGCMVIEGVAEPCELVANEGPLTAHTSPALSEAQSGQAWIQYRG